MRIFRKHLSLCALNLHFYILGEQDVEIYFICYIQISQLLENISVSDAHNQFQSLLQQR
jgi:hypothetical protein